ncbi:MAG TPA: DNA-formamidopyrimidine glycosylase family protein, partial [Acidobacteriota bacterium]
LPEVEMFRRYFERYALGKTIRDIIVSDSKNFPGMTSRQVGQMLSGRRVTATSRRGKYLIVSVDHEPKLRERATGDPAMVIHFGMTGDLQFTRSDKPVLYSRTAFRFTHGTLHYVNMRRFGGIWLVDNVQGFPRLAILGPDPIAGISSSDVLRSILGRSKQPIKQALMNQKLVAGIGNLYADEILFQSRINPRRRPSSLKRGEWKSLHHNMKTVLEESIRLRTELERHPKRFLLPHRHGDRKCPRCGMDLKSITQGQRTTYYCPACQE